MTLNPSTERAEVGGSWPSQGWSVHSKFQASLKLSETLAQNKTKQKPNFSLQKKSRKQNEQKKQSYVRLKTER